MKKLLSVLLFTFTISLLPVLCSAQNTWIQQANMGGGGRDDATGFAIGNYGYILTGTDTGGYCDDVWRFNSDSNSWMKVDTFPGFKRIGSSAASIHGYGYVIGGEIPSSCFIAAKRVGGGTCGGTFYGDLWRYNPDSNTWVQLVTCPGAARNLAVLVADSVHNMLFYGTGNNNGTDYMTDWWGYDLVHNHWVQLTDFPGRQRCGAVGFCLNGMVYVGTGNNNDSINNASSDFWQYSPDSNSWKRVADVPGSPRDGASSFTIGNYGYVCLGIYGDTNYMNDGWRYNPLTNNWLQIAYYGGGIKSGGVGFTINGSGYIGTGFYDGNDYNQLWEYTFENVLGISSTVSGLQSAVSIYPNPSSGIFNVVFAGAHPDSYQDVAPSKIEIYSALGEEVYSNYPIIKSSNYQINLSNQPNGIYFYQLLNSGKVVNSGKLVIVK